MNKNEKHIEEETDKKLIIRYKDSGNKALFGKIFNKYLPLVFGVCMKYLKDEEKSKDAVMDIFIKLQSKLQEQEITHFRSWLFSVTKNHCFEILRKNQRVLEKENRAYNMYSEKVFHLNNEIEKENEFKHLEECMELLVENQKQCIRLFYFEKKTYQHISDEMKLSWGKVRSLIQNGRRNLKLCMEKKNESVRKK